jgi:hypothetical protein
VIRKRLFGFFLCAALAPAAVRAADAPDASWAQSAQAFVPQGYVAGSVYRTDRTSMTGALAVFRAGADDPRTAGSAFDWGHVLVVKLAQENGALKAVSGQLRERKPEGAAELKARPRKISAARDEADYLTLHNELAAKVAALPAGTAPCDFGAWSEDKDPKGLNVRAEPSAQSKVLGTLPPPFKFKAKNKSENAPDGGWLTEFRVIGFKDGWFLIEGATPPGKEYEDEKVYPKNAPKPYAGRGWVAGNKIGAQYANGDTKMGGLFQAPHVDAQWTPAKNWFGNEISADGGPKRILACSGTWALVESHDGVRGWWRRLCSSQVTNCS